MRSMTCDGGPRSVDQALRWDTHVDSRKHLTQARQKLGAQPEEAWE